MATVRCAAEGFGNWVLISGLACETILGLLKDVTFSSNPSIDLRNNRTYGYAVAKPGPMPQ